MKNKNVGYLLIGISVIMAILVYIFNRGLKEIVGATCTHGTSCSMYSSLSIQTEISLAITTLILIIGLFLIFSREEKDVLIKRIKMGIKEAKRRPIDYSKLDREEKVIVKVLEKEEGTLFQSDIVEKTGFDKVKVTRILDRLEGKQLIERKRRGMTNVVILK